MPLARLDQLLKPGSPELCALASFNVCTLEMLEGVVLAAEETQAGVMVGFAERHWKAVNPWSFAAAVLARLERSPAAAVFHFDHASSLDSVRIGIELGCTSVMIDGSALPLEDNIQLTRAIVEMAHAYGVAVEGEIGGIGGVEGEIAGNGGGIAYTRPQDARRFAQETGVDLLAIGIGTVHGLYRGRPNLRFDLLDEVKAMVPVPLVLHGGTGISAEDMTRLIRHGIRKVNVFTELSMAAAEQMRKNLLASHQPVGAVEVLSGVTGRIRDVAKTLIRQFDLRACQAGATV